MSQNYLSAKNIYRAQNDLVYLSENIRFADFMLWQHITQAGFAGCRKVSELNLRNFTPMNFGIKGYDSAHLPGYLLDKMVKPGTDVLVSAKASVEAANIIDNIPAGALAFRVTKNLMTSSNNLLLIADCKNAELFAAVHSHHNTIHPTIKLTNYYNSNNTEVRRFEELTFFISNTGRVNERRQPIYSLYFCLNRSSKKELISDITDMQIYYGINPSGKGRATEYLRAKEINSFNLWDKVLSVAIELKMQSNLLVKSKRLYIKLRERS